MNAELERVKGVGKRTGLITHADKTDAQLREIILTNVQRISYLSGSEAAIVLGENEACTELLKKRQEEQARRDAQESAVWDAQSNWRDQKEERVKQAILNAPNAVSYHGHLVAATLEDEDGLTAQQIRQWSEELQALEDTAYETLLTGLVEEGVLHVDAEGRYYLLQICTEDLLPPDPIKWVQKKLEFSEITLRDSQEAFLFLLDKQGYAGTELDWGKCDKLSDLAKKSLYEKMDPTPMTGKYDLENLCQMGFLTKTDIPNTKLHLYYFPVLGKKGGTP